MVVVIHADGAQLTLVRHGESDWNVERLVQGQNNRSRLTAVGREQARGVAVTLTPHRYEGLVSSDLARARDTAAIIGAALSLEVHEDARLRERGFGDLEGGPSSGLTSVVTGIVEGVLVDPDCRAPGGESFRDVVERARSTIESLDERWPRQRILVVTHGVMIRAMVAHRTGAPLEGLAWGSVNNCSVRAI